MGKNNQNNNQKTTATTTSEPSSVVKPYLQRALTDAETLYKRGAPGYYPGQQVAPMSNYSSSSLNALAQRAAQGSPVTAAAQQQLTNTLGGQYLSAGNPYFANAVQGAIRPMVNNFTDQIMPGLDSNFSSAGRYGSGAHALASSDAASQLNSQIGDIASQMAYQNYGDERQNQIRGMLFAPEMAAQDYRDIAALQQAGQGFDQYNQAQINANMAKYGYNATKDMNYLQNYMGILNGYPGGTTGSVTQGPPAATSGGFGGAATGALGGAMTGAKLGAMMPTPIPGVGALGGAVIGGLGGLFGG